MQILKAILLGIIQGLSEFLPVSSSGNLYFFSNLLNIDAYTRSFDIVIHAACLIALLYVFNRDVKYIVKRPSSLLTRNVILATLPSFIVFVLFRDKCDSYFLSSPAIGVCFIATGAFLFYETVYEPGRKRFKNMNGKNALTIGLFEAAGVIPGVSRTAMVVGGALQTGFDGRTAYKFSCFTAIPAILGRIAVDLLAIYHDTGEAVTDVFGIPAMIAGVVAAFLASLFALAFMRRLTERVNIRGFAYYLWAIGAITLLDKFVLHKIF